MERRDESITEGLQRLTSAVGRIRDECASSASHFGERLIDTMISTPPGDDVAILVARVPAETAQLPPQG